MTIDVSENDLRAIAKRGYEGAVTSDHDQALGCAVTPALRRNRCTVTGAVTASLFGREEVLYRGAAPARSGRQMRQDSVAVLDCDFELVALNGDHPSL